MKWYEIIYKHYHEEGTWTIDMVRTAVKQGKITPEQFKQITGEDY